MTGRHYRLDEIDAARRYAERLRQSADDLVRVVRGHGEVVVYRVQDERTEATPREPDRRGRG